MATPALNTYGDSLVATTGTHGADIASQRLDGLDRRALEFLLARRDEATTCVDLGCGLGWQGVRFGLLGASAALYDLMPPSALVCSLLAITGLPLAYRQIDLAELTPEQLPAHIDILFSQRFLHYLPYAAAQRLIAMTTEKLAMQGRCFLSVSGLKSELGQDYAHAGLPVEDRFTQLAPAMAAKHGIAEPIGLYTEDELVALAERCGLRALETWSSAFGNVKGVFARND